MRYVFWVLLLAGCAPMSADECRTTDWYQRGEQDALMGNRPLIDQYAQQCSGATPSEKDYMAGWAIGYSVWNQRVSGSKM